MQTKHRCVLIHIWNKGEVGAPLNRISPPVKYFTDRSKAVLLLWIICVFVLSCVCYVFVRVCLYVLCGHLLGKGWPLGSRLWCLSVSLSLSHWYPGSGVVLDCIDSWSLHPYLLCGQLLGKGWPLGSWWWCLLYFVTFPCGILGQVWYLIISFSDLFRLSYFSNRWCKCENIEPDVLKEWNINILKIIYTHISFYSYNTHLLLSK